MSQQANPTVIVSNIPNSLHNRYVRLWSYFLITPEGEGFYLLNGIRIPMKEFEDTYPIELNEIN